MRIVVTLISLLFASCQTLELQEPVSVTENILENQIVKELIQE